MANDQNLGFEHRFAFGDNPHTWGASSLRFEVVSSTFGDKDEVLDGMGLLGTRTRREDRTRFGIVRCDGDIVLEPSIRMLDYFMPKILGAAESTDTFNVADSLIAFDMFHDPFGTGAHAADFDEIYVNRASLRFAPGLLRLTLSCIGKSVAHNQTWSGSIPALGSTSVLDDPLVFYDSASGFTLDATGVAIDEGELIIDNVLDVRFRNSQTAQSIRATDRIVSLVTNIPYTAALKTVFFGDNAAADATIVLTRSTCSATFTLFNLKAPDEWPSVGGKGDVPLILRSAARGDASDPDIRVVIDETV